MKAISALGILILMVCGGFARPGYQADVQLTCFRTVKATNQCHFNFTIDGAHYRYVDIGCKYSKKQDEVIKKAKEGTLALAREWKVDCGTKKP